MAVKEYYHDLDLVKVGELLNTRLHNVTTTQRNSLAATLSGANEGLVVFDTDEDQIYIFNGSVFLPTKVQGAMVYKGTVTSLTTAPVGFDVGFTYVFTGTPGTLTWAGQTFSPDPDVEVGDVLIYRGSNIWDIIEGNDDIATETTAGNIRLATQAEVNAGSTTDEAVTPATLAGYASNKKLARTHFETTDITALTPKTVTHNLNLSNKDAFVVRTANSSGSEISLDVDSVDTNSLTLTAAIGLTGVRVFVVGF